MWTRLSDAIKTMPKPTARPDMQPMPKYHYHLIGSEPRANTAGVPPTSETIYDRTDMDKVSETIATMTNAYGRVEEIACWSDCVK